MKVLSHRGASAYAPENTLKAFRLAVEMGARDHEFDIHRTSDGVLVVHHDYDLKHTAGREAKIAGLTYDELKKINVSAHFAKDSSFQCVPRLEEVLDVLSPGAGLLNFEVKNDGNVYPGIEAQLLSVLAGRPGLADKALVSSFDHGTLLRFRALSPDLKLAYLGHGLSAVLLLPAVRKAKAVGAVNFHMALRLAFKPNVALIKKYGFSVFVYTVNEKSDAVRMKEIGVDGIFSNFPDILEK